MEKRYNKCGIVDCLGVSITWLKGVEGQQARVKLR
jgi:hypothetical protein